MNTTTTPGFTGEASLYNTSRHYRASYRALDPPGHPVGTIRPSEIDVPGEVIEIEDDAPWSPPPWGGHTGPGTTGGGAGEPGGGEPGGGGEPADSPPKIDPEDKPLPVLHGCSVHQTVSSAAGPCLKQGLKDQKRGVKNPHYLRCTGKRQGNVAHPKMECCQERGKRTVCKEL
jgi:hypothetical protein